MDYESLLYDFADRTRHNLEVIQQAKEKGECVYEVTQLINSLLGLLVLPNERFTDIIPKTPLSELVEQGWPVPSVSGEFREATDLRELVRYLRNAISHFNIDFHTDSKSALSGITVWNCETKTKKRYGKLV
ncbi:HEPN family nuclease [Methylocella tundrae]|uniref:pEK499-p136 HEPN domain-containing protein n=1 Tax=Methylocella tundrae TaxID=227605 RepID=A0A4U8Z335_METTU|nr:HEPN family nuclease [Methylocella tundrae]WPP03648.1 HEPN family nuclease [Methylocella tundrae]VFU09777.1 conserved protein of unknown function [Methylocella tundrae]